MADDISHFYTFGSVRLCDLAEVCGNLQARVWEGKLLVHFADEAERVCFEGRLARHSQASVRNITRLPDPSLTEAGQ